ncbi:MAG: hypothetical protein ACPL0C_06930 [Candidatus Bathyarchaeales archaeon]
MGVDEKHAKKILEEFARFKLTMEDLRFLRQVSNDLRSFREMLTFKKYD